MTDKARFSITNQTRKVGYLEDINFARKKIFDNAGNYNLYGVIRPLTAISYKGKLFLSGHYGNINP